MLRHLGFEQDQLIEIQNLIFVVRSVKVDYLKPARFNDLIDVTSAVIEKKKTSLIFKQSILREDILLCDAEIRIACLDAQTMKPKPIPTEILEKIT
jgi:acyl-CoA thioester hydrolase